MTHDGLSYEKAGVDIDTADAAKRHMAASLETSDPRVLNRLGAFASLFDARLPGLKDPVLVLKMEEPGSKQLLALRHGAVESLCRDLINHLVNDVIVMGATPLAILDTIVCGKLEKDVVTRLVDGMARAAREQGANLVGGETSEQPGVLAAGTYILSVAAVGVVERAKILDGSRIAKGDAVLAIASNGLHTNGYTLVRKLLELRPALAEERAGGESFLQAILRPHVCYYQALKDLFGSPGLHGLAHITGGGIQGNLNRILPAGTAARIDRGTIRILPVFRQIRDEGNVPDADMLRTFNMGVGMTAVVAPEAVDSIRDRLGKAGHETYPIGTIEPGDRTVEFHGGLGW